MRAVVKGAGGERAMLVIAIPIGAIITVAIVLWAIWNISMARRRKRRLEALRVKQEAARLKSIERALRPSLIERWRLPFRRGK